MEYPVGRTFWSNSANGQVDHVHQTWNHAWKHGKGWLRHLRTEKWVTRCGLYVKFNVQQMIFLWLSDFQSLGMKSQNLSETVSDSPEAVLFFGKLLWGGWTNRSRPSRRDRGSGLNPCCAACWLRKSSGANGSVTKVNTSPKTNSKLAPIYIYMYIYMYIYIYLYIYIGLFCKPKRKVCLTSK